MTSILPFAIEDAGTLSTELSQQIQQLLLEFAQNYPVMGELLVATADGYEVAAVLKEEDPGRLHKIAAGEQKAITVEGERDNILLWQVATQRFSLCLTVVASAQEPLGQLFWLLRQLAAAIAEICHAQPDLPPLQEYYYE